VSEAEAVGSVRTVTRMTTGRHAVLAVAFVSVGARVVSVVALYVDARHKGVSLSSVLTRFDGGYYQQIALHGYPTFLPSDAAGHTVQSDIGFFPLFPSVVRAVMAASGLGFVAAALLVNVLASTAAAALIFRIAQRELATLPGLVASSLWVVWPISFVLNLAYAEAMFSLLAAGCLALLLDRRYMAAGAVAALASATRPNGLVLAACCGVAFVLAKRRGERLVRPALGVLVAPAGIVAYFVYLWARTGHLDAWLRTESQGWHVRTDGGLDNITRVGRYIHDGRIDGLAVVAVVVVSFVLLILLLRDRAHPILVMYSIGIFALALTTRNDLSSTPRFVFVAFPILLPLARRTQRMPRLVIVGGLVASATVMALAGVFLTTRSHYPP
jgi:hypothetical protein